MKMKMMMKNKVFTLEFKGVFNMLDFERINNVEFIDGYLFMSLWKDLALENKYLITRDLNYVYDFYADNNEDAIKRFKEFLNKD